MILKDYYLFLLEIFYFLKPFVFFILSAIHLILPGTCITYEWTYYRVPLNGPGGTERATNMGSLLPLVPGSLCMFTELTAWVDQAPKQNLLRVGWITKWMLSVSIFIGSLVYFFHLWESLDQDIPHDI